jgi:hypothetical protein
MFTDAAPLIFSPGLRGPPAKRAYDVSGRGLDI